MSKLSSALTPWSKREALRQKINNEQAQPKSLITPRPAGRSWRPPPCRPEGPCLAFSTARAFFPDVCARRARSLARAFRRPEMDSAKTTTPTPHSCRLKCVLLLGRRFNKLVLSLVLLSHLSRPLLPSVRARTAAIFRPDGCFQDMLRGNWPHQL